MGWQGWLIIAIVILVTALFAATRSDWQSMLVSALVPPLIIFPLIFALSRFWRDGARASDGRQGPGQEFDLLNVLARTNPIMFLLLGALSRRSNDDRYRQLLSSGPFGMGQQGYLIALIIILAPLILALVITALAGQPLTHSGSHFP